MTKENIKIVKFQPKYAEGVSAVILDCAKKFLKSEATKEALNDYIKYNDYQLDPKAFVERRKKIKIQFIALDGEKVVGVIAGRVGRIGNLFVLSEYHRRGIATKLYKNFEDEVIKLGGNKILLRSSLYAVPFYVT